MCNTAKLRIMPVDEATVYIATCILEPHNASRHPILLFYANQVKVVTYICACDHAYSCNTWVGNIANIWLPYTNIWENFKGPYLLFKKV